RIRARLGAGQRPLSGERSSKKQEFAQWRKKKKRRKRGRIAACREISFEFVARKLRSELRWLLGRRVWHGSFPIEALARGLGHVVAQLITQLGAIELALLAKLLEPFGVGCKFLDRRHSGRRRCLGLTASGQH